jgi:hypothetical protein
VPTVEDTELSHPAGQHDMIRAILPSRCGETARSTASKPGGTEVVISVEPLARITPEEATCRDPGSEGPHRALHRALG